MTAKHTLLSTIASLLALLSSGCATNTSCQPGADQPGALASQRTAADDTCLQGYAWQPSEGEVVGVVIVLHGLRDHAVRYSELAESLTARGFAVYAQDLRGHGRSGGRRQRFDSIDQLLADLDLLVEDARRDHPDQPVFIFGHSFGGLLATHYASAHQATLAGVVLSGAALQLLPEVGKTDIAAARFFGSVFPNLKAQELDDEAFVSTPEAKAEFQTDPLIDHVNLPARSAKTGVNGILDVSAHFGDLDLPLLILHGGADTVTPIAGSRELYRVSPSGDKQLVIYDDQFHDLLHEPVRERMLVEVTSWLEARS